MRLREKHRELRRSGEQYENPKGKRVCAKAKPESTVTLALNILKYFVRIFAPFFFYFTDIYVYYQIS